VILREITPCKNTASAWGRIFDESQRTSGFGSMCAETIAVGMHSIVEPPRKSIVLAEL
jgi:hypothetical protein